MTVKCQYCGCDDWGHVQLAAANERANTYLGEMVRLQERIDYYERTRICHSRYAKRPILYTDTVNGEQCCVDNLWAVSTEELNESSEREREFERAREAFNDWDNNQYPKLSLDVVREYFNPAKEG